MTIPTELAIADFLPAIARRLGLLTEEDGKPIHYSLVHEKSGLRFFATDMLGHLIAPNDLLSVEPINARCPSLP